MTDDLISRQEALKGFVEHSDGWCYINALPLAEVDVNKRAEVGFRVKICPKCGNVASYNSYFGAYLCDKCDWREDVANTIDLISRQEAIDEIKRLILQDEDTPINDTLHNVIGILEDLPSTQRCNNRDLIERETIREIIYSHQEPLNEHQLNKIPAVDANADYVRCKDCDMWNDDGSVYAHSCAIWSNPENGYTRFTEPNDFCSYAWRKNDERFNQ